MNIFTQFFKRNASSPEEMKASIRRDLLRREAEVGKHVFGAIPEGHDRSFFRLDKHNWVWQETWTADGAQQIRTTKYVVRERDIVKSVNGGSYQQLQLEEVNRFEQAVEEYAKRVKQQVYGLTPA